MSFNRLLSLFLILVIVAGCVEDTIDVERKGILTGTVVDQETNAPLADVKITTNPASTTVLSDAEGNFEFTDILVNDYSVQAELEGYETSFEAVEITENTASTVFFELETSSLSSSAPNKPELLSPENDAEDIPLEVDFLWSNAATDIENLTYTLELRNGSTNELQVYEIERDTTFTVENLQLATTFFWQVKASDGQNNSVASELSSFRTVSLPNNPYLFVKQEGNNNVIFSGDRQSDGTSTQPDFSVTRLTDNLSNSFKPKKNLDVNKIAFLRTTNSETHLFSMDLDGTNVTQLTREIPISGFRLSELSFAWINNGASLLYPSQNRLYKINNDGSGLELVYETSDGSLISEVATPDFDNDLLVLKTNNLQGYGVRIFTYRISSATEETVLLAGGNGAAGSIDITASGDRVVYYRDLSEDENENYRRFESRLFVYEFSTSLTTRIFTDAVSGEIEYDCSFTPSEGGILWVRRDSNIGAIPNIYTRIFSDMADDILIFTESFMPDWE